MDSPIETTGLCPFCRTHVDSNASKCPNCQSVIGEYIICPDCRESASSQASVCRHCGHQFEPDSESGAQAARDEILCQAAERQVQAVISHRLDNGWTTYKSRILQADAAEGFVILQHPEPGPGQAPPELAPGEQIGVSFRRGHKKCLCSAHIELLTSFKLSDGQAVAALQIPWPEELQEIQRRVYYRAEVPAGRRIEVAVWDGGILDRNQA